MTTDGPTPVEKPKPKEGEQPPQPAPLQTEADQARRNGDGNGTPTDKPANAPKVEIVDPAKVRQLDDKSIAALSKEVDDALHHRALGFLWSSPDFDKIKRNLENLNPADRAALEKAYDGNEPGKLRRELKEKLSEREFREVEAQLNRTGDRTNDAGAVVVALARMKEEEEKGTNINPDTFEKDTSNSRANAELREILSSMTADQIAQLRKDFAEKYPEFKGKSLEEVIRSTPGLGADTAAGLDILMKGMTGRDKDGKPTGTGKTAEDMTKLGEIAINSGNLQMLAQSINGDTPEAVAARKALAANPQLMEKFNQTWGNNQAAKDILADGRVSIATIAAGNAPTWWFDNPKNTTQAIDGATEKERTDYRNGRAYAGGAKPPEGTDPAEVQRQIDYYNRVHKAFVENGGGYNDQERNRQVAIWEDHMLNPKGSIISQMADTHEGMSGFLGIGFGWTGGHNKQDLFSKVEGISKEDWQTLHDEFKANPNGGGPFMQRIRESLKTYADEGEQQRILALLEQKAKKDKYEDAVTVRRGVMDTIEDNRTTTLWGAINTGFTKKNIGDSIANMTEDEAKKYRENTGGMRDNLEKWIKENMTPDEQAYAHRMLERRAGVTPQDKADPAKQQQAIERLASGADNSDTNQRLRDIEIARTRISAAEEAIKKGERKEPLTEQEKKAKELIATEDAVDKLLKSKVDGGSATERLKAVEAAMTDPGLRARLNKPEDQMTAEDKQLKGVVSSTMMDAVMASGMYYAGSDDPQAFERLQQQANAATDTLLKNGFIPPDLKMDLGFKAPDVYNDLYKEGVTQGQRDAAIARMSEQEKMIALQVGKNEVPIPGSGPPPKTEHKMEPVDELRSMIVRGASSEEMITTLKRMKEEWLTQQQQKPEGERQQWADHLGDLYSQYEQRYGKKPDGSRNTGTMFDDIMSKMKPEEQLQTRTVLTRERLDGRQVAYDAFNIMQDNQGGANFDASHDTAERQVQAFRDALQEGQGQIPPEKLDELTKLFAESIKQYKESKEKAAEIITTAIIMAAAIVATVASGGAASPMLILALGGMGALTKVAGHMIAEGGSFEMTLQNVMKRTVEGFVTGSLSALGPESFSFLTGTSRIAIPAVSKAVLEGAEGATLRALLKEGGETAITKSLRQSFADAAAYGREMDFKAIAKSLLSKEEVLTTAEGRQVLASDLLAQNLRTQFELQTGQVLRTAGQETFLKTAQNVIVREGLGNVVVGEAGNIASTPFINYVNGKGFNLDGYSMGWSSLMPLGFAPGMRLAVHGGVRAIQFASPMIERAQKWGIRIQEAINPNYVEFHPGVFAAQHPELSAKVIDRATGKEVWHTGQTEAFRFDPNQHSLIDATTGKPIEGPTPFLRKASAADQTGRVISGAETGDPNITILSRKGDRIEAQVGNNKITTEGGIPTHVEIGDVSVTQGHTSAGMLPTEVKIKDGDKVVTYKQDATGRWVDEAGHPAPFSTVGVNQINGSISFEYPPGSGQVAKSLHLNGEVDNWMDNGTIMRTSRDGTVAQAGTFDLTPSGALEGPLAVKPTGTQIDAVHFAEGAKPQEVRVSESLGVSTRATSDGQTVVETVRTRGANGETVEYHIDTKTGKYVDAEGKPAPFQKVEVNGDAVSIKYAAETHVFKGDGSMQRITADGRVVDIPREAQSTVVKIAQAPEGVLSAAQKTELVDNTLASFKHQTETLPEQFRAELKARQQELKLTDAEIDARVKQATEYNQRNFARTTSEMDATIARGAGTEGRDVRTTLAATLEDSGKRADMGAALRKDLLDVKVTRDGGGVADVWSKFEADPKLSIEQKDRIFNVLAESKHYYAETVPKQVEADLRAKAARGELDLNAPVKDAEVRARLERGEITPAEARIQDGVIASRNYQEVNWKHTRGEIDQVLESTRLRPNMTANQVEDAILGSIYSDMVKSPSNFIVHNIDGARAASEILPKHFDMSVPGNAERVQGIVTAIKEHQIGPPQFMSDMNEMFIGGSVKSQLTNNVTALKTASGGTLSEADAAILAGLEKRLAPTFGSIPTRQPLSEAEVQFLKNAGKASNPNDPEKLLRDYKEYLDNINEIKRKISDPLNPANHTPDGSQLAFTDAEKRLLNRIGVQDWTVPHEGSPHYLASRSIIDGDSLINYATPDGWAKIAAIRGPDTPFAFDKTVFDSLASAKASYNDAFKVMSDEARTLGQKGVALTEDAVQRVRTSVNVDGVANDGMEGWLKRTVEQRGQQYGYGDTVRQRIWESEEFKRQMADVESQLRAKGAPQAEIDAAKEALKARVDKVSFWDPDAIPLSQLKQFGFTDADIQARMQLAREIRSNMVDRLRAEQTNWAEFNTPPRVVAPGTPPGSGGTTPLTTNRPANLGAGFYRDSAAKPGTTNLNSAAPVAGKTDARTRLGEELTEDATKPGTSSTIGQGGPASQQQQAGTHGTGQHQQTAAKPNDDMGGNAGAQAAHQQPGATDPSATALNAGATDPNAVTTAGSAATRDPNSAGFRRESSPEMPEGRVAVAEKNDNARRNAVHHGKLIEADGTTRDIVFHSPQSDAAENVARFNNERAAFGLNNEIGFESTYPRTAERTAMVEGKPVKGFIQEDMGRTIDQELIDAVYQRFGRLDHMDEDLPALLRENPRLRDELAEVVAERLTYGDRDISVKNITRGSDGKLHNIDMGHAFDPEAAGLDSINTFRSIELHSIGLALALEHTEIPPTVRAKLADFAARYGNDEAVTRLANQLGVPPEHIKGAVERARTMADSGLFPTASHDLTAADNISFGRIASDYEPTAGLRPGTPPTEAAPARVRDSVKVRDSEGNSQVFSRDGDGRWVDGQGKPADFIAVTKDLESGNTTFHYPPDSPIATRIHQGDGSELIYRADGTVIQIGRDGVGETVLGKWNAIPSRVQAPHQSTHLRQQIVQKLEGLTPSRDAHLDRLSERLAETNLGPAEKAELEALARQSHTYHTETLPELYRRDLQTRAAELGLTQPEIEVRVQQARDYYARNWESTRQALDSHLDRLADSRDAGKLFDSLHEGTSRAELAARLRSDLLEVRVTGRDGLPTDVWSKFEADLTLSQEQKDRIFNVLAEARHYYTQTLPNIKEAELQAALKAGTIDQAAFDAQLKAAVDYQVVNWKHTRGEIDQVLESTRLNKAMTAEHVEDAILGSTFSDMIKTPQNFIVHNIHGAQAAEAILPRYFNMSDPQIARRVEGLLQATKEHQIGPAIFMSNMNELFIGFSLRADLGAAAKGLTLNDGEKAALTALGNRLNPQPAAWDKAKPWDAVRPALTPAEENLLKKLGANKNPADANALLRDFQDYNTSINGIKRKIATPFDTANHTADGGHIKFTEAEQRLLNKIGVSEWSVPHPSDHYHVSRAIVDGDSLINYATPDGWAKIAAIRNVEPFILQDATIFDALRSAHDSFQDARLLMTDGARVLGDDGLARTVDLVRYVRKGDANVQGMDHFVDNHVRELVRKQPERFGYPPETAQLNPSDVKLTYWDKDAPTIKSFNDEVQALQRKVAEETQRLGQASEETKAALARAQEILDGRKRLATVIRDEMVARLREQQGAWADLTMQKPPKVDPHHLDFDSQPIAPPRPQGNGFDATPRDLPPGNLHDTRMFDEPTRIFQREAVVGADNASQLGQFRLSSMDGAAERFDALTKNEISLGRFDTGVNPDVQFSGSGVSRRHARIYWDEATGKAFIEDVGSTNGTWVHDGSGYKLVTGPTELKPGDRIRLGRESDGAKFTFEEAPKPKPSLQDTLLIRLEDDPKTVIVEPARRPVQLGEEVRLDGNGPVYEVIHRNDDGNILIKQNNRHAALYQNRTSYDLKDYTKVQSGKRTYFVDRDGKVWHEMDFGDGHPRLVSEPKMAFVPEARLQTLGSIGIVANNGPFKVNDSVLLYGERARVLAQDRLNGKIVVKLEDGHTMLTLPARDLDKYEKVRLPGSENDLYRRGDQLFEYDAVNNRLFPTDYRIVDASQLTQPPKPIAYGVGSDVGLTLENGRFTSGKVLGFDNSGDPIINVNAARPNPAALEFSGRVTYVDGFDPRTGDAIINGATYTRVDVGGGQPMYRGPDGKLYQSEFSQSGRGQFLYLDERFIVHPRDQVQLGLMEVNSFKAADFDDVRSVRMPQNVTGDGVSHLQSADVHDIYKGATIDFPGHELPANFQHVIGDELSFSRTSLGLGLEPLDKQVSRNQHALVKWDPKEQLYYVADTSSLGTWVVRPGQPPIKIHKDGPIKAYYLAPGDELRLGAVDGHAIKLNLGPESKARTWDITDSWSPEGTQIFFDGKPIHLNSDGAVAIGRLEQSFGNNNPLDALNRRVARDKHVTIEWTTREDGRMGFLVKDHTNMPVVPRNREADAFHTVMALPAMPEGMGNGTYIIKPNGQQMHIPPGQSMFIEPGDVVRLGSPDGPPIKFVQTMGSPSPNGMGTIHYRENGEFAVTRADGTTRIQTRVGDVRLVNRDNQIIHVTDLQGNSRRFTYNEDGSLKRIDFSDGSHATTTDGRVWTRTSAGEGEQPFFRGSVSVEPDGSLRFSNLANKEASIHRLDGTIETFDSKGRVSYTAASRDLELDRLKKLAADFPPGNRERFQQLIDQMVTARADLPASEQALVYLHLRRLLQADSGSMLGMAERRALAEQMIFQTINPRTIDQGANNTCNVTTIEKRIFAQRPSEAINLITDVATKGKYVTASGVLVDFSRVPGLLTPDAEARALLNANFLRMDGARSYASQVFEVAAVNIKYSASTWSEVADVRINKGDIVVYEKVPNGAGGEREQLVKYSVNNGRLEQTVIADSPHVGSSQLPHIHNEIVGGNETGFIFMGSRYPNKDGNIGNWRKGQFGPSVNVVTSAQDLARELEAAAAAGKFPAVITVHTRHPYFGHGQGGNPTGGGGHVMNIHGFRKVTVNGREQMLVDVTNQWGVRYNREFTVEDLYAITGPMDPSIPGGVVHAQAPRSDAASLSRVGNGGEQVIDVSPEIARTGDGGNHPLEFSYSEIVAASHRGEDVESTLGRINAEQQLSAVRAVRDQDVFPFDPAAVEHLNSHFDNQPRLGMVDRDPLLPIGSQRPSRPELQRVHAQGGFDLLVVHKLEDGSIIGIDPRNFGRHLSSTKVPEGGTIELFNGKKVRVDHSQGLVFEFDDKMGIWRANQDYRLARAGSWEAVPPVPSATELKNMGSSVYHSLAQHLDVKSLTDSEIASLIANRPSSAQPHRHVVLEFLRRAEDKPSSEMVDTFLSMVGMHHKVDPGSYPALMAQFPVERLSSPERMHLLQRLQQLNRATDGAAEANNGFIKRLLQTASEEELRANQGKLFSLVDNHLKKTTLEKMPPAEQGALLAKLWRVSGDDQKLKQSLINLLGPTSLRHFDVQDLPEVTAMLRREIGSSAIDSHVETILHKLDEDPSVRAYLELSGNQIDGQDLDFVRINHINARMELLANDLQQNRWLKQGSERGRPIAKLTVITFGEASDGGALSYLFQKATGIRPDIKVVKTVKELEQLKSTPGFRHAVVFDDITKAKGPLQEAIGRSTDSIHVDTRIQSFHESQVNLFEIMPLLGDVHVPSVDVTKPTLLRSLDLPADDEVAKIIAHESELRRAQIYLYLRSQKDVANRADLAALHAQGMQHVTLKDMYDQARALHASILSDVETTPNQLTPSPARRIVYVSDLDQTFGSTVFVNNVYRIANDIPEKDFVSFAQLKKMAAAGDLKGATIVHLDDTIISGDQTRERMTKLAELLDLAKRDDVRISVGALAHYQGGLEQASNDVRAALSRYGHFASIVSPHELPSFQQLAESIVRTSRGGNLTGAAARVREVAGLPRYIGKDLRQATEEAELVAGLIKPYQVPNNNPDKMNVLYQKYLALPGAHSERSFEHTVVKREWHQNFGRNRGVVSQENRIYRSGGFTEDDLGRLDTWAAQQGEEKALIIDLRKHTKDRKFDPTDTRAVVSPKDEETWVGMYDHLEYENIPLSTAKGTPPTDEQIEHFLQLMKDNQGKRPIIIHCEHGCDRTGLMIALYQVEVEGKSIEEAFETMRLYKFNQDKLGHMLDIFDRRASAAIEETLQAAPEALSEELLRRLANVIGANTSASLTPSDLLSHLSMVTSTEQHLARANAPEHLRDGSVPVHPRDTGSLEHLPHESASPEWQADSHQNIKGLTDEQLREIAGPLSTNEILADLENGFKEARTFWDADLPNREKMFELQRDVALAKAQLGFYLKHADIDTTSITDLDQMAKLLAGDKAGLEHLSRVESAIAAARDLRQQMFSPEQIIEMALANAAKRAGLPSPRVTATLEDDGPLGSYRPGKGSMDIRSRWTDGLFLERRGIDTITHEFAHLEQDCTIIRLLADELGIGAHASEADILRLQEKFLSTFGTELEPGFAREIMTLRNGENLAGPQLVRAHQLRESTIAVKADQAYRQLQDARMEVLNFVKFGQVDDLLAMIERGEILRPDQLERLFGTAEMPPVFKKWLETRRRLGANWGAEANITQVDQAAAEISQYIRDAITASATAHHPVYRQRFHEEGSHALGELMGRRFPSQLPEDQLDFEKLQRWLNGEVEDDVVRKPA